MARTNVGRRGGGGRGRGRGRGLSDHEGAHGWGQISIRTNTSGTCSKTNATISADIGVHKSVQTNTSRTRYETNANTSGTRSETNANTSGTRSETNANTTGTRSETNANISSNSGVQKSVQTNTSRTRYETNANTSGSRSETNTEVVDKSGRDELWTHFKARNESVKLAKADGVQFEGADCTILKPYNPEWIKSKHWEDMIDRVWKTKKWLNKAISCSKNQNTVKEGSVSKHCAGSITISQHKRKFEQVHKRPPTAAELFELTHTKNEAIITSKSERVATAYNGALVEKYGSVPANHPIYDDDLWKKCAKDDMKGGVFGWGSMSDPQYTLTGTPSTTGASSSGSKDVQGCSRDDSVGLVEGFGLFITGTENGFFSPKERGRDNGFKRKQTIVVDVPAKGNDLLNLDMTNGADIKKHTSVVSSNTLNVLVVRTMGPVSYAKLVNDEPSRKSVNFRTLITMVGNGVDVAIPLDSIRAISESEDGLSIIATKLGTLLMLDSYTSGMCMHSWGMLSYARAMIKLQADEELQDTIVVAMPKLVQRIDKERQLIDEKLLFVDDDGKLLPKVVSTINADSDSAVEEVFDEHTTFMASTGLKRGSDSGYGSNSLWK
nr:hypothetical protein [Tanacetum cinerariifolium]